MQWDILAQAIVNGVLIGGVYSLASVGPYNTKLTKNASGHEQVP